jgi:hypothetical protein
VNVRTAFVVLASLLIGAFPDSSLSQEAGSIDLTDVQPRMTLRRPPVKSGEPQGVITNQPAECSPAEPQAGALRTTLVSLDRNVYRIGDHPLFQVQIENVGTTSLALPFSPHLADLQPEDAARKFAYSKMTVEYGAAANDGARARDGPSFSSAKTSPALSSHSDPVNGCESPPKAKSRCRRIAIGSVQPATQ